ncbi:MAG: hypothetical protein V4629_09290, partial [Pseudomonadota bacterium]
SAKEIEKIRMKDDLKLLRSCILKSKFFFDEYLKNISSSIYQIIIQSLQQTVVCSDEEAEMALKFILNQMMVMKVFARFNKNDPLIITKNFIFENLNAFFLISEKILNSEKLCSLSSQLFSDELCLVKNSIMIYSDSIEPLMPIFESLQRKLLIS